MKKKSLEVGTCYTREEISSVVGGDWTSYLPYTDGRVVCGCFNFKKDPSAPEIVLVGKTPKVIEAAEMFASQSEPVPVFIKQKVNCWEYVGEFVAERYSTDPAEFMLYAKEAHSAVVGVLFLKEITR